MDSLFILIKVQMNDMKCNWKSQIVISKNKKYFNPKLEKMTKLQIQLPRFHVFWNL